jgi:hypothetical protein
MAVAPVTDDAPTLYETCVGRGGEGIVLKERIAAVSLLIALIVGGCGGISLPPPAPPPPKMCRAPGGGYVPCDFGYHGTMGL